MKCGKKLRVVGRGTPAGNGREIQVAFGLADGAELGKTALFKAATPAVVFASMAGLVARGIDCGVFGEPRDQGAVAGKFDGAAEEFLE